MKKITDLMLKLNEIDFKTHGAYKRYKTKHKMRPTTKVTIGGKTTTAGEADKVVAKADAIKRGAPDTDDKALDQLAKVGMKSKAKNVDDFVAKDGDDYFIDAEDMDTGEAVAEPGEEVTFTQDGVEYTGTVSDEAEGRDDGVLKLDNVLSADEKSEFGAKQKGIGAGGENLPGPTSDENSVSGDAEAERRVLEKLKTITKDNDVDLCSISVPGTNLFCAGNKQIPRDEMPQLKSKVVPGGKADELVKAGKLDIDPKNGEVNTEGLFKTMLEKEGVTMKDPEPRQVTSLKATQNQLVGSKVNMFAKVLAGDQPFEGKELPKEDLQKWQNALREPIIVSKDGYILDGHHRWAALVQHDIANGGSGDVEMDVKEVDMGATELVDKTNKFTTDMGLQVKSAGKKAKKEGTIKLAKIIEEELVKVLNEQRPMFQDTPNEFAYLDFKKWAYKNRTAVKNILLKALEDNRGDGSYLFMALTQVWQAWANKKAKEWSRVPNLRTPASVKFGRALAVLMKKDNLIIKRAGNKLTTVEGKLNEAVYDNILKAVPDSYSYKKLAVDIAKMIKDEYGSHNIRPFTNALMKALKEGKLTEKTLKKGDVIKFKNGENIVILGPKGDGYDYQERGRREKGHHPKGWFDMMIRTGKAMVEATDINDPVLVAFRASRKDHKPAKVKARRISFDKYLSLLDQQTDIGQDIKDKAREMAQTLRDMEQEAEPEGGKVADRYGSIMMKQEKEYAKLKAKKAKIDARVEKYRMS